MKKEERSIIQKIYNIVGFYIKKCWDLFLLWNKKAFPYILWGAVVVFVLLFLSTWIIAYL